MLKSFKDSNLIKALFLGMTIMVLSFLLGPYSYNIESNSGVIYYFFSYFCLYLGLRTKHVIIRGTRPIKENVAEYDAVEEKMILIFEIIATICCFIWIFELLKSFDFSLLFQNDLRAELSNKRTFLSRISEFGTSLGVAAFVIANTKAELKNKIVLSFSNITLWYMGICCLAIGARWRIVLALILYFVVKPHKTRLNRRQVFTIILFLFLALMIISVIYSLFKTRGLLRANELYMFYYGDMKLKHIWEKTLVNSRYSITGVVRMLWYFGQPIPVFSYVYVNYMPTTLYHGAHLFRLFGMLCKSLNISFPQNSEIMKSTFSGFYTGTVYEYIIDWGIWMTPVMLFFTGRLFSKIEKYRLKNRVCASFYPLTEAMILFSPFYYIWHVGGVDFVITDILVFYVMGMVLRRIKKHR